MVSTWIMLVLPGTPTGTPAVSTTRSPCRTRWLWRAAMSACVVISSVLVTGGMRRGATPQSRVSLRQTRSSCVSARMGCAGRKWETQRGGEGP